MTWLVDVVLILVIAIAGYVGYKKGIVRMLLSFLTIVLALALAFVISAPLADLSYGWFFEKSISATVDAALENQTMETVGTAVEDLLGSDSVIGGLGGLLGFDAKQAVTQATGDTLGEVGRVIKEDIIKPPMTLLLQVLIFILFFVLLWIILSVVARAISRAAKLPLVRGVNAVFGAVVGVITGVVLAFGLCALINLSMEINPNGLFGITEITRENSVVYKFISDTFLTL